MRTIDRSTHMWSGEAGTDSDRDEAVGEPVACSKHMGMGLLLHEKGCEPLRCPRSHPRTRNLIPRPVNRNVQAPNMGTAKQEGHMSLTAEATLGASG